MIFRVADYLVDRKDSLENNPGVPLRENDVRTLLLNSLKKLFFNIH